MKTLEKLQIVAKSLNEVLGLDPKLKVVGVKEDALKAKVKEAVDLLEESDIPEIADNVRQFMEELELWPFAADEDTDEDEADEDEADEDADEDEADEDPKAELIAKIEAAAGQKPDKAIKALKAMVAEDVSFKAIKNKVKTIFEVSVLTTKMFECLGVVVAPEPVKGSEKPKTETKLPAEKKKDDQPNQTAFIRDCIKKKMKSVDLVAALMKTFDKSESWSINRFKLYEKHYGPMGENDPKLK